MKSIRLLTALVAAILMGIGTPNAQAGTVFEDFINPAVSAAGGQAEVEIFFDGFANGTIYDPAGPGFVGPFSPGALDALAGSGAPNLPAPGALPTTSGFGEDTWGVARISSIKVDGATVWADVITDGKELTFMFYNSVDIQLINGPTQTIHAVDIRFDLYEDSTPDFLSGVHGRTGSSTYTTVTDGVKVLSATGDAGHFAFLADGITPASPTAEFENLFTPASTRGEGEAFFEVVNGPGGGAWDPFFDTNTITNGVRSAPGATADVRVEFSSEPNTGAPFSFILEIESSSAQASAIPMPSAVWQGLIGMSLLLGVGVMRRRRALASVE